MNTAPSIDHEYNGGNSSTNHLPLVDPLTSPISLNRREVVAVALTDLWRTAGLQGTPLIMTSPETEPCFCSHHPLLLHQLVQKHTFASSSEQLVQWERIPAPPRAGGIASVNFAIDILKPDLSDSAGAGDTRAIPEAEFGWIHYTFSGWEAFSAYFLADPNRGDCVALVALPEGRLDEWLAFLAQLLTLREQRLSEERRGRIEVIGDDDEARLVEAIRKGTFNDVILPDEVLALIAEQRTIFDPQVLSLYESLRVPRLRKILLIGPPGTGKTSIIKAEASFHASQGGVVFYVCAQRRHGGSWELLSRALEQAAESCLPAMVIVEDFELFLSDRDERQRALITLDGTATPDNPAGTLLLATSNHPEQIDPRIRERSGRLDLMIEIGLIEDEPLALRFLQHFLGAAYREADHSGLAKEFLHLPGSHIREVCIAGAMHAISQKCSNVSVEDILLAHTRILEGRDSADEPERMQTPSARRNRLGFLSKKSRSNVSKTDGK